MLAADEQQISLRVFAKAEKLSELLLESSYGSA